MCAKYNYDSKPYNILSPNERHLQSQNLRRGKDPDHEIGVVGRVERLDTLIHLLLTLSLGLNYV